MFLFIPSTFRAERIRIPKVKAGGLRVSPLPLVLNKLNEYEGSSALEILGKIDIKESDIKNIVSDIFSKMLSPVIDKIMGAIDISSIVKEKIDAMSIEDLESLVLKVMKKELNMIVNLGALIGLILGMINIFI